MKKIIFSIIPFCITVFYAACRHEVPMPKLAGTVTPPVTPPNDSVCFEKQILPILQSHCAMAGCHDHISHTEDYDFSSYATTIARGVKPGEPTQSKIYTETESEMPPSGYTALSAGERALISKWISEGAKNNVNCNTCDTTYTGFAVSIKPINDLYCRGCHTSTSPSSGIAMETYNEIKVQVNNGKYYGCITRAAGFKPMPQGGNKLPDCSISKIRQWIAAGAPNN